MVYKDQEKKKLWQQNHRKNNHDVMLIDSWKRRGIKLRDDEDWDSVYIQWFIQEKCDDCECELQFGKSGLGCTALDHDHVTGFIRGIVCQSCNVKRK